MKFTPYLSLLNGRIYREITRLEAAEILRGARKLPVGCLRIYTGRIAIGPLDMFTKHV